jgi:signal transduction histidine kinase
MRLRVTERWISTVRVVAVPFAAFHVAVSDTYPPGYERWAWVTTGALAAGAVAFFLLTRIEFSNRRVLLVSIAAQIFDTAIVAAYVLASSYEDGTPTPEALYLPLIGACVRFQILGGIAAAALCAPVFAVFEDLRADRFGGGYRWDFVTLHVGLQLFMAMIVGWLVRRLEFEGETAVSRAHEAEELRDELGQRADLLDAANRCARALSSSLVLDEAFGAFIRELRGLVPFERVAIILAEDGLAQVMAAAGSGSTSVFPAGSRLPLEGTLLEDVLASNRPIYRRALDPEAYPEEREFVELGLQSRLAVPLLAGTRTIGMLSLVRERPDAFSPSDIELAGLLGRLVATAVQNIHSFEAERRTVEELRRLSNLRADFISLVSHELRTPLAAVVGSARTLQQRWPDLTAAQRDTFVGVIADESDRLANLVGEVLDTSRIDAGTFSYSFTDVDVAELVDDAAAAAKAWQEVEIVTRVPRELPAVRGDRSRLRQVLSNLIDNAVKYSPVGGTVEVRATTLDGRLSVDVTDRGRGIAPDDQQVIFEKFGRVRSASAKPGAGLGLYIARAIAEAHGGSLDVTSMPGRGATFTLTLPLD